MDDIDFGTWVTRLARIPAVRAEVSFTARQALDLDEALNVRIHRLWAKELRHFFCLTAAAGCKGCAWGHVCGYDRWVAARVGRQSYWLAGVPAAQRIEPGHYRARVTVIGSAAPSSRAFGDALVRAIHDVRATDPRAVLVPTPEARVQPLALAGEPVRARRWRIDLHTPVVRKAGAATLPEACPEAPWLNPLVHATVGRVRDLLTDFASDDGSLWPPFPDLRPVRCLEEVMQPVQFDYAKRGEPAVSVEGWRGYAVLEGEVMRTIGPLLAAGAEIGIGKKTTFGFGDISAAPLPDT